MVNNNAWAIVPLIIQLPKKNSTKNFLLVIIKPSTDIECITTGNPR